jgi:hypothetical protein
MANENENQDDDSVVKLTQEALEKLIDEKTSEKLKDIKSKLESAYGKRDEALAEVEKVRKEQQELEIERLKTEGKHTEALQLQIEELKKTSEADKKLREEESKKREAIELKNSELSRDLVLRQTLAGKSFKNKKAIELAYMELVGHIEKDDAGQWIGKGGKTIDELVDTFEEDDENSFLFKAKGSSGIDIPPINPSKQTNNGTSLFNMKQSDVIALAKKRQRQQD